MTTRSFDRGIHGEIADRALAPGLPGPAGARRRLRADVGAMLREQRDYRELLFALVRRELLVRYKQTAIGFAWAIATPSLSMIAFSIIFTRVAPLDTGVPYPVYAYAGLLPWAFFASAVRAAARSLTENHALVTKVKFPREVLPFSCVLVSLVDLCLAGIVLAGLMWYYAIELTPAVLLLPIVLAAHVAFTTAIALLAAMAQLLFRDVKYILEVVLPLWMLGTSVVFPVERIGGGIGQLLGALPLSVVIDAHRAVLLRGELPAPAPFAAAFASSMLMLLLAWTVFHRAERRFAEEL